MDAAAIKKWQDENGGSDGDPEGPDANGVTTYRSKSGNTIAVGPDGTIRMRGFSPPTGDAAQTTPPASPQPAQASSGVGVTTQQELEARVAKNPNLKYQGQSLKTKTIPGQYGLPDKQIQVPVVSWVDPATGQTLTAEVGEGGGTYTVTEDGVVPGNKGTAAQSGQTTTVEGTQRPDGSWDNSQPREVTRDSTGKLISSKPLVGQPLQDWQEAGEKQRNGGKTDAQIRQDKLDADAAAARNKPSSNVEHVKGGDGKDYTRVTTVSADGKSVTIQSYGPDNKAVAEIPGDPTKQAGPVATGPAMPEIVVGATSAAITKYQHDLMADPSLTPAQREAYLSQFIQTAQIATNDATALQRQQESNLNASINLATTKSTALQNGQTAAVNFANSFVGKLPADSHLAGQAFGAMMLMNVINMQHSGLEGIQMPGTPGAQKPAAQPASTVSPGNPQAVAAQLEAAKQAGAATAAAQAATAVAPAVPTVSQAAAATTPPRVPAAVDPRSIGAPEPPAAQSAAPQPAGPGERPLAPDVVQGAFDTAHNVIGDLTAPSVGAPDIAQPGDPGYGDPSSVPPTQYGGAGDAQSRMPGSDFAVLGQYQQPQRQQQPTPDIGQPLALLKAQIQSTPPWRISPELEQQYVNAGGDLNDVYAVPGRAAA